MREKLIETAIIVIALAVVARAVWELLGPLLPSLFIAMFVGWLLMYVLRGPHAGRFRK